MAIWDESYLNRLVADAEAYLTASVDCIFDRFSLAIITGQSVYTLPSYVTRIVRITWKGKKLHPLTFPEFCGLSPASAIVSSTVGVTSTKSTPLYYVKHPTNYYDIRLYPTPGEDVAAGTDLWSTGISSSVIVSCFRSQSASAAYLHVPVYIKRRIKKAYVLYQAFAKEGKGQDLQASQYYKQKLEILTAFWKEINSDVFLCKQRQLGDIFDGERLGRPARPVLPPEYGQVCE